MNTNKHALNVAEFLDIPDTYIEEALQPTEDDIEFTSFHVNFDYFGDKVDLNGVLDAITEKVDCSSCTVDKTSPNWSSFPHQSVSLIFKTESDLNVAMKILEQYS